MAQAPSTQAVTVAVSDNGVPPMSAAQSFNVTVSLPSRPGLDSPAITNGQFGLWVTGDAGPDYTILTSTNLVSWSAMSTSTPVALPWFWTDTNPPVGKTRFYRTVLGP
jgi:hypothetical protein